MKKHSSENYLDQLLNSVNEAEAGSVSFGTDNSSGDFPTEDMSLETFERELFGEPETKEMLTARDEEDFLREFEAELLKDDIPNFSSDSIQDVTAEKDLLSRDSDLSELVEYMNQVPEVDENAEFEGEIPGDVSAEAATVLPEELTEAPGMKGGDLEDAVNTFDGEMEQQVQREEAGDLYELPLTEDGELDLSGMAGSDLMDILAEGGDLSDLGDMLSADADGIDIGGEEAIASYAENEMQRQQGKSSEKAKKGLGGFFKKLAKLMFGEDTKDGKEGAEPGIGDDTMDISHLSEENQQILKELEAAGEIDEASTGKRAKAKKEKPPKKVKPKKKQKDKAPKEPKVKGPKVKEPKEKDTTPPLPKGPVRAIWIMVVSMSGLILLGTKLLGYQANVSEARSMYREQRYVEAYGKLAGCKIKDKDLLFYEQLTVLAPVSSEYNSYLVFANSGRDGMALDSLICSYGRYYKNRDLAVEKECLADLENLGSKIVVSLLSDYEMTGAEALELYQIKSRKEYTIQLHYKLQEMGLE